MQERYVHCDNSNHQLLITGFNFRLKAEIMVPSPSAG